MGGASAESVLTEVQQRTAEQLFRTLGELKGGAMKFGQAMSIFEAALPDELAGALPRAADQAPGLRAADADDDRPRDPRPRARRRLEASRLVELDPVPAAAASIGQVHRGRWADGREVAVKVQYPGSAEALTSDLRQLSRVARGLGPLVPGLDVKALIAEVQARAVEELDYQLEAEAQRAFAAEFRDDPDIVVPDVVADAGTVLVTEWMDSAGLAGPGHPRGHPGGARPLRPPLPAVHVRGARAAPACCTPTRTPATSGCSPDADGAPGPARRARLRRRRPAPRAQPARARSGALIRIALLEDYDAAGHRAARRGLHPRADPASTPTSCAPTSGPFLEPASVEEFHFSRAWMQEQFRRVNDPSGDAYTTMLRLNLPPAYMLIHRTFAGGIGVLSQLEARVPFRQVLTESLPGFADPA